MIERKWIRYCHIKKYYLFNSFDEIRTRNNWKVRLAYRVTLDNFKDIKAITGAVIYGYLHKDFWRKVKKAKSVQLKGRTYNFLSSTYNYKDQYAPVSVLGIHTIWGISPSTATRLKQAAVKAKLLECKPSYEKIETPIKPSEINIYRKALSLPNLVCFKKKFHLRSIDLVCPLFEFTKRRRI